LKELLSATADTGSSPVPATKRNHSEMSGF